MLLGAESWEIYDIDHILNYWQQNGGINGITTGIAAGQGRCGGPAYYNTTLAAGPIKGVPFATPYQGYAAWANKPVNFNGLERFTLITPLAGVDYHLSIAQPGDGSLQVWQGGPSVSGSTILGTVPAGTFLLNQWYHIGFEWFVDLTNGWVKVWVDGVLRLDVSGVRTVTPLYPTFIGSIQPTTGLSWGPLGYLADMYWGDAAGPAPWNSFMGDLRVQGQTNQTDAVGGGTYQQWTPSTGTDHGALTDEIPPDDDATYVATSTAALKETFTFDPITLGFGDVFGMILMPNMRKTQSATRLMATLLRSGGVDTTGDDQSLRQTYAYYPQVYQVNPATGNPWTAATVDASEAGVTVTV
jgi:hypothetical protein